MINLENKQEAYEKHSVISRNDEYTTGNLLDYPYHQNYYKLISIDLSRQTNTTFPQQINFAGKLEEDNGSKNIIWKDNEIENNESLKIAKKLF